MSLTVHIYYRGENGAAKRFAEEMTSSGTVAAIRAERGNLQYEYFYSVEDEETVLLVDRWENQAALDAHHETQMMRRIMELREKYDLHMRVEQMLSDETGRTDGRYVRT